MEYFKILYCNGERLQVDEKLRKKLMNAYPIHNMEAHEAEDRKLFYVGYSPWHNIEGHRSIKCYYEDELGVMWSETRVFLDDGHIVNSRVFFFKVEKNRPRIENEKEVPKLWNQA